MQLLDSASFTEEVDVRLVQLQVLVTDRSGSPVSGLTAEDFEIVDPRSELVLGGGGEVDWSF